MDSSQAHLRQLHDRALDEMTTLVESAAPTMLGRPTPCAEWDVRALIEHTVGLNLGVAEAVLEGDAEAAAYADRPVSLWSSSVRLVRRAFQVSTAEQVYVTPVSSDLPFSVSDVLTIHLLDVVVHAWDLAVATGVDYRPSAEAVAAISGMATLVAARAVPSTLEQFAAPIRSAAGHEKEGWSHVLRLLGRDPGWSSPVDPAQDQPLQAVAPG
jgi:uncharacterized protein (TIGR03086 family)